MDIDSYLPQFGIKKFRPGQREVIESVIQGRDCLCIMPTGGGKSLCFQLPALMRPGTTIVVSPLIALMKDQVDSLQKLNIRATYINSSLDHSQRRQRTQGLIQGEYSLVYLAPERLRSQGFIHALKQVQVNLLAVDEAHCISQWGHDFRPDYSRLGWLRNRLGNPQTIALTATATATVRDDIARILELKDPATFVSGFSRPNLQLRVESPTSHAAKDQQLLDFLKSHPGVGIIYAATRKSCEHIMQLIREAEQRPVAFYHAGIESEKRKQIQDDFMTGQVPLIVATNAFGMGIDKRDVRFVIHYNLPGSLEAYYQEAGRAGRDGEIAECLLYFSYQDRYIQEFFIESAYPSPQNVRHVFEFLKAQPDDPIEKTLLEIQQEMELSLSTEGVRVCEALLEKAGAIERLDSHQNQASVRIDSDLPTLVDLLPREAKARRAVMRGLEDLVGDLRGERVFFAPQQLAEKLNTSWDRISRALRELVKLEGVDYVPPFRGRAIHVRQPNARFDQLDIDFDELDRRKKNEYQKLERLIQFARSPRCRQLEILEYFGDTNRNACGGCDNCQSKRTKNTRSRSRLHRDPARIWYAIRVALSGAARTHGRVGKQLLVQMLAGANSKKMKSLRLNRLPTYGRLAALKRTSIEELITHLIDHGCLHQAETTRFRPVIEISEWGRQLLSQPPQSDLVDSIPDHLAQPISLVLKEETPTTETQGAAEKSKGRQPDVAGSSAVVIEKEGTRGRDQRAPDESSTAEQLDLPEETDRSPLAAGQPAKAPLPPHPHLTIEPPSQRTPGSRFQQPESVDGTVRPSYYWTWRLFDDGYDWPAVCQIRGIDRRDVVAHLTLAAENSLAVSLPWVLSSEIMQHLDVLTRQRPEATLARLISNLPAQVDRGDLLLYRACIAAKIPSSKSENVSTKR